MDAPGADALSGWGFDGHVMPNGKVLAVGGDPYNVLLEIFDPAAGTWSAPGTMVVPRDSHTATLLTDGRVLVTAGSNGLFAGASEIFDPATRQWSATGSLPIPRQYHIATRLSDGRVLVAGGQGGSGPISGAAIYDPSTGVWMATANPMGTPRISPSATLLPNGKVLVAGGFDTASLATRNCSIQRTEIGRRPARSPRVSIVIPRRFCRMAKCSSPGGVTVRRTRSSTRPFSTIRPWVI